MWRSQCEVSSATSGIVLKTPTWGRQLPAAIADSLIIGFFWSKLQNPWGFDTKMVYLRGMPKLSKIHETFICFFKILSIIYSLKNVEVTLRHVMRFSFLGVLCFPHLASGPGWSLEIFSMKLCQSRLHCAMQRAGRLKPLLRGLSFSWWPLQCHHKQTTICIGVASLIIGLSVEIMIYHDAICDEISTKRASSHPPNIEFVIADRPINKYHTNHSF